MTTTRRALGWINGLRVVCATTASAQTAAPALLRLIASDPVRPIVVLSQRCGRHRRLQLFATGTRITLSVTNERDAIWHGACSSGGNKQKTCTFTLNSNASVTANVQ